MTRLIDADAFLEYCKPYPHVYQVMRSVLKQLPIVDAVPVIRCYECRYYNGGISDPLRDPWCDFHEGVATNPNNYCSWAKREGSVFENGTNE